PAVWDRRSAGPRRSAAFQPLPSPVFALPCVPCVPYVPYVPCVPCVPYVPCVPCAPCVPHGRAADAETMDDHPGPPPDGRPVPRDRITTTMSTLIAISGKGGVGKTTVAALLIGRLIARGRTPVLAVDADPNTCLDSALGVQVTKTVGGVREEARAIAAEGMAAGISKQELLELKIAESLVESQDFDLIAMGRSEGPGCYCYANNVLRATIHAIAEYYPCVVLDNEAGLENLSRRIVQHVDLLLMTADPSRRGLDTILRLHRLTAEMGIAYDRLALVVNRLRRPELPPEAETIRTRIGADFLLALPDDEVVARAAEEGRSLLTIPPANPVAAALDHLLEGVGL
ncbi:MAG: AAA family ATPase, partial [Lentisphaeria bacterium]|nr:AAA family ATPase [Lentisphaeria bacterium]